MELWKGGRGGLVRWWAGGMVGRWWDWDKFEVQLKDLIDAFNFLYGDKFQLMVEIDVERCECWAL